MGSKAPADARWWGWSPQGRGRSRCPRRAGAAPRAPCPIPWRRLERAVVVIGCCAHRASRSSDERGRARGPDLPASSRRRSRYGSTPTPPQRLNVRRVQDFPIHRQPSESASSASSCVPSTLRGGIPFAPPSANPRFGLRVRKWTLVGTIRTTWCSRNPSTTEGSGEVTVAGPGPTLSGTTSRSADGSGSGGWPAGGRTRRGSTACPVSSPGHP
jgi:hypothetical protein